MKDETDPMPPFIGGLSVSAFLTLIFVPTLYWIIESWRTTRHEYQIRVGEGHSA